MTTSLDLWDLLHAGDWACAHGDNRALARVAGRVAEQAGDPYGRVAQLISELADSDFDEASSLWGSLSAGLRLRSGASAVLRA